MRRVQTQILPLTEEAKKRIEEYTPQYILANAIGVHTGWISSIKHASIRISKNDPKIKKLLKKLKMREEDFFINNSKLKKGNKCN